MKTRILYILLVLLILSSLCACDLQGPGTSTVKVVASFALDAVEGEGLSWGIVHAMQLALEEADYRAGDLTVELVVWNSADENGDMIPEVEEANAQKAAADPDVLVYLGSISSGGCKISLPILNRAGVAQFSPSATYPGLTKSGFGAGEPAIYYPSGTRTFFRVVATDDMQGPAGALWAQDQGLKRVYIIEQDELYGRGLARTFRQAAEAAGLTIVGTSAHAESQTTDLDQIVAEVSAQQFDLIYYTGFRTTGVPLIQALRAAGVKAPVMGADAMYTQVLIEVLGPEAEGFMATFPGIALADLGTTGQGFSQRFQDRFNREPDGWNLLGYDMIRIVLAAIAKAGKADRAAVLEALRGIRFEGLAGHWSFDENGDTRLLLISGVQVKDDKWQSIGQLRVR